jgi:hypothetical protein
MNCSCRHESNAHTVAAPRRERLVAGISVTTMDATRKTRFVGGGLVALGGGVGGWVGRVAGAVVRVVVGLGTETTTVAAGSDVIDKGGPVARLVTRGVGALTGSGDVICGSGAVDESAGCAVVVVIVAAAPDWTPVAVTTGCVVAWEVIWLPSPHGAPSANGMDAHGSKQHASAVQLAPGMQARPAANEVRGATLHVIPANEHVAASPSNRTVNVMTGPGADETTMLIPVTLMTPPCMP